MSTSLKPVRKAVIPVAGLGTRFLPVTRVVPKALLPVLSTPLIHYAVQEAVEAGVRDIVIVMSPGMESVADYFSDQPVLEDALNERGQTRLLEEQQRISSMASVAVLRQHEPRGLGHAVLMARDFVGDEPFAVILPDDLIWANRGGIGQLVDVRNKHHGAVVAAMEVPDEVVSSKGIIDGELVEAGVFKVRGLVEKPKLEEAPSNLSIVGRYVLEPDVFPHLAQERTGAGGEIQLTDAMVAAMGTTPMFACAFEGVHADAGVPFGMLQAALIEAERDPDLRAGVLNIVRGWGN